ncbi:hypothetical protein N752_21860 [Desulforamulus aquiferis]|nr:hypothetical protein [Desulforamulus aquiferis]RYD03060.1 hypothetical protein N752_21860 [Desulforamulus aquiferis]
MISLLEVPVAYLHEELRFSRRIATIISVLVIAALGSTATLSGSALAEFTILGRNMFDLQDFLSSNVLMPIGGIFIALFAGWKLGSRVIFDEATNQGTLNNNSFLAVYTFIVRYVAPVAIVVVLLYGLGIIKA